ncbi:tetraacyldisaccharide 4'-kinase [Prevotella cerevisiae]|uniref:Tetraacyldisaccharide 4'-kinase n=1 Tax=Segatella cerevisiae TaxID=2053716 RepID=A0ABT1BZ94_9BACT|nr:tetraacyldisaccharide 4'-kinase [Segatella cerevisiae]MCO6026414.1 tetraacyldisaccharide 4'-kinase [Segatella cerevisiae]
MRTEGDFIKVNEWLLPLSWLYGLGVRLRNWMFDVGILKTKSYDIPVISVGNITVGGSGKTPHVEYLVNLLQNAFKVAVLSRGYKRKSHGYVLADNDTKMSVIGDEPYQMKQKFRHIYVAVDKNRREGIERLQSDQQTKDVDVILLDDAFQHRFVQPGISILLIDYHRLIIYDKLLPAGRLREPESGKNRADIVIVSKCPKDLKPMEFRVLTKALNLYPYQELYFTTLGYCDLRPLFPKDNHTDTEISVSADSHDPKVPECSGGRPLKSIQGQHVLLLTGIASPKQILQDLTEIEPADITPLTYPDHHNFCTKDIIKINDTFESLSEPKVIITTEKDAARLQDSEGLSDKVKENLFVLPIRIRFMLNEGESFNQKMISYVRKNSRNSILVKDKDENKSKDSHHSGHRTRTISFRDN